MMPGAVDELSYDLAAVVDPVNLGLVSAREIKRGEAAAGLFWQGANWVLRGRKRRPEERMHVEGSKNGGRVYADKHPGSKMEIPDEETKRNF
jgi:hypothetical protein